MLNMIIELNILVFELISWSVKEEGRIAARPSRIKSKTLRFNSQLPAYLVNHL